MSRPGYRQTEQVNDLEKRGPTPAEIALGTAFAALLTMPAGPAAPVLGALAAPLTIKMTTLIVAEWTRKTQVVAAAALEASGLGDPEEFCEALAGNADMIALTQKILWAASISGNDGKIRALGTLLGGAVAARGDKLDETNLLVNALAELEAPHAVILDIITASAPDDATQRALAGPDFPASQPIGWLVTQIEAEIDLDPAFILAAVNTLVQHGLAGTMPLYGSGSRYAITKFGRALTAVMRGPGVPPGGYH